MKTPYYVYSTIMSPGNQGVFQLLKEMAFEEFWHFAAQENDGILRMRRKYMRFYK